MFAHHHKSQRTTVKTTHYPRIYISGPYRGPTDQAIDLNIAVAKKVGALVALKGYCPLIPHTNTQHMDKIVDLSDQFWLDVTMEMMRAAAAVVLCPGWYLSSGTMGEIQEASRLDIPVFMSEWLLPPVSEFDPDRRMQEWRDRNLLANTL